MAPELWFGLFGCASAVFTAGWAVLAHFSNRRYQEELRTKKKEREDISKEVSDAIKTGQGMVKVNDDKIEAYQKYNTQQFKALDSNVASHDKRIRVLESQLVAKDTVKEMLDDRVKPIEAAMEKMEHTMEKGFKDLTQQLTLSEMNSHNTIVMLSRLEGKLEGSGIIRSKSDD
jgi:hypothetical protein